MIFQNKPIIRYLYWQNRHDTISLQILQFYQKYLGKSARFDFILGNKKLIAFLKWEKNVYCFSQMGNNSSLLFSNGKRNFIVFLKKEKVAHIAFSGQEKPQNLRVALDIIRVIRVIRGGQGLITHFLFKYLKNYLKNKKNPKTSQLLILFSDQGDP